MPVFNSALARRVVDQIKSRPDLWDQTQFVGETTDCGTTMCFAGWTCELSGVRRDETTFLDENGKWRPTGMIAQELLDLTYARAYRLFYDMTGDVADIERIIDFFAAHPDDDSLPDA